MQSFAFEVAVRCPLELVFEIYVDIDRWPNRSIFGEIRWVKGSPSQEGRRLTIETRVPFRSMVDQVVQHYTTNESVSYLSHVLGITSETHVMFVRVSAGETLIRVSMHLVGKVSRALGFAIEPVILKTTRRFFEDLCRECEAASKDVSSQL
jgi:imidazoleglycerol phosphate dehydratase HisB